MSPFAELLDGLEVDPASPSPAALQRAVALARHLQRRGAALQTPQEKRQQRELEKMVESHEDRATMTLMTDQAFRAKAPRRVADQLVHILDVQGVPRFFSTFDRALLKGFQSFGNYLPGVAVPLVKDKMRNETANVILPADEAMLSRHLEARRRSHVRMNVNFLGEALLGEADATARLESYLAALQLPAIEVISVKATTLYSQITPLGRRHAVKVLRERLELLYRAAAKARFVRGDGAEVSKFVYLDMEEYRDLGVTVDAFLEALSSPGLEGARAGIALQAYVPDSCAAQRRITAWAQARVAAGGAPVTIRLVKGANMEAERVEASVAGWPQAPYTRKIETDANYKRMLGYALEREHAAAVHLGVASHNLFDVAYAMVLAHDRGLADEVQFEMLEGMANHQRRALGELVSNILLYAPATRQEEFVNAIGYLVRRLDENTGPQNFLRHAFKLEVGSDVWDDLERAFLDSHRHLEALSDAPRRTQDRRRTPPSRPPVALRDFDNDPHTDLCLPQNLEWAEGVLARWRDRHGDAAFDVPQVIAGEEVWEGDPQASTDPSRPGVVVARYRNSDDEEIDRALACARDDPSGWRSRTHEERGAVLARVADAMRAARGALMGACLAEAGKLFAESDPEISEAIDFVVYYAASARAWAAAETLSASPRGAVAVIPPWNFPVAIPCGGVAAALAAGNTVILKPASESPLIAYLLCRCFWEGGVPREALQYVNATGPSGGARIVRSDDIDTVILTGGTRTALAMLDAKPAMHLLAETGGKNATVVTAMSDRELAIKHVVQSAFGHSGQKCSATSLLVLEAEVYDDPSFRATLCDAVKSLRVGSAWDLETKVGPLIRRPLADLERGLKELEQGERWAVMPRMIDDNPKLWSPGVKWGVTPGSFTHRTEFFGPLLAVMRAENLDEAIEIVNGTGYGLTSGIESLDAREQAIWLEGVEAGNLYVNRGTTGAIVLRQPFGGVGKSAFGPGIKAGGPSYVAQLMTLRDVEADGTPDREVASPEVEVLRQGLLEQLQSPEAEMPHAELRRVLRAIDSYDRRHAEEFAVEHDPFRLVGQDNLRRYRPMKWLRVRVSPEDSAFEIVARVCAAKTVGCVITVSLPPGFASPVVERLDRLTEGWGGGIEFVHESDAALAEVIARRDTDRVRYAGPRAPEAVLRATGETGIHVSQHPVLVEGRVELLWYVSEQSVSHDYHRYGNLGPRAEEERRPVA